MQSLPHFLTAACLLAGAVAPGPARADDRPTTMPTRDVDVTYNMTAPGGTSGQLQTLSQRMRWDTKNGLLRVDPPSPGVYTIMNYPEHKLLVISDAQRAVTLMHANANMTAPGVSRSAQFTRVNQDSVAGLACTDWQTSDSVGQPTKVCLTDDGVLLRAKRGDQVLVQAVKVAYGPTDPSVFKVPYGYRSENPPQ